VSINIIKYQNRLKFQVKSESKKIFDPVRKKYVALTPEEFVRQLFVVYLIEELKIPVKHIAVERSIKIHNKNYRFDILVFDNNAKPKMIVECKSHKVKLTEAVAIQVSKYNIALNAKYLCVTNGKQSLFYRIDYEKQSIKTVNASELMVKSVKNTA